MKKVTNLLGIIIGIILIVGPHTFLHVCGAGMKMDGMDMGGGPACKNIPIVSLVTGIVLIIVSLVSLIASVKESGTLSKIFSALQVILGVVTIGIPTFIVGVCNSAHMHCNMVTKPALIIFGVVTVIIGILGVVYQTASSADAAESRIGSAKLNEQLQ